VQRVIVWVLGTLIVVGVLVYAGRDAVLTAIGGLLIAHDEPGRADAIVVLSGSLPDRILEAVDLYQAGLAPRIILTREFSLPGMAALRARGGTLPEHHEQNLSVAEQLGVPAAALSIMPRATASTLEEARALVAYLRSQQVRTIVLVTSKLHTRRASMTFRAASGGEIAVAVVPSRYDPFPAEGWWRGRAFVRRLVIEYGKLAMFLVVDRWRAYVPRAEAP
jgi:uncharacterized SAM-binding protein YcdF (DUF218 family)